MVHGPFFLFLVDPSFQGGLGPREVAFQIGVVGGADYFGLMSDLQDHVGEVSVPPSFGGMVGVWNGRGHRFSGALNNGIDDIFGEGI